MFNIKHSITFKNNIYLYIISEYLTILRIIILFNIIQYLHNIQFKYRVRCKYNSDFAIIIKLYYIIVYCPTFGKMFRVFT